MLLEFGYIVYMHNMYVWCGGGNMLMQNNENNVVASNYASEFPVDYAEETLRNDIYIIFLHEMLSVWMLSNENSGAKVFSVMLEKPDWEIGFIPLAYAVNSVDEQDRIELSYEDIRKTPFVMIMEELYRFAYLGIGLSEFNPGFMIKVEEIVKGLRLNNPDHDGIKRCQDMIDLAMARDILEETGFFPIDYIRSKENRGENGVVQGALTIRQMALLAGMEEMSIRAAANSKRVNPLMIFKGQGGKTLITLEEAKRWLIAKKRYVIFKDSIYNDIDIQYKTFKSLDELADALQRLFLRGPQYLYEEGELQRVNDNLLKKMGFEFVQKGTESVVRIEREHLEDEVLVEMLGQLLKMKEGILHLKVKQAMAYEKLASIEKELQVKLNYADRSVAC